MKEIAVEQKYYSLVSNLYQSQIVKVRITDNESDPVKVEKSVREE